MYTLFTSSFNTGLYVAQVSIVLFPVANVALGAKGFGNWGKHISFSVGKELVTPSPP